MLLQKIPGTKTPRVKYDPMGHHRCLHCSLQSLSLTPRRPNHPGSCRGRNLSSTRPDHKHLVPAKEASPRYGIWYCGLGGGGANLRRYPLLRFPARNQYVFPRLEVDVRRSRRSQHCSRPLGSLLPPDKATSSHLPVQ